MTIPAFDDPTQSQIPTACIWEVMSRKVGNVHPTASFPGTDCVSFLISAAVITPNFGYRKDYQMIGATILDCTARTRAVVGTNTNLGILLLLTPLAHPGAPMNTEGFSKHVLNGDCCGVFDAQLVYEAIRIANPGGLGDAPEQDVRGEPTVTLLEAMKLASDRDMVARQYANGFADVFDFGVPAFLNGFARFGCVEAAVVDAQLRWLAAYPDSLIARKNGPSVAEDVRQRAAEVLRLGGIATPEGRRAGVALDHHLRSDGNKLNPGTTADLITACLFVALRENKVVPSAPFRWQIEDWL
ncbi:MAG: triphosphoribosyl-dephospho-CoA synthase [Gemmataceae bacterium]|nr:triphosphoribosyl-dephospho-CoA synthase [Gemmataceae bacterium]